MNQVQILKNKIGLEMFQVDISEIMLWQNRNSYALDQHEHIIGLSIFDPNIKSWKFLESFSELYYLNLSNNKISNLNFLYTLKNLVSLNLSAISLKDFKLVSSLNNLKHLEINGVMSSDYSPLSELSDLEFFSAYNCNIVDGEFIKKMHALKSLLIANNDFENIDFLSSLENLNFLDISSNSISNITSLKKLKRLSTLHCNNNPYIKSFSPLNNIISLKNLYVEGCDISNLTFLSYLKKLLVLDLSNNPINSVNHLAELTNLENLNLNNTNITNINFLETLTNLTNLELAQNNIVDFSSIEKLQKLQKINLRGNHLNSIKFIKKLENLIELDLNSNKIKYVDDIGGLINLKRLILNNNIITSISPLKNITKLQKLHLYNNDLTDISILEDFLELRVLDIEENQISDISSLTHLFKKGLPMLEYIDDDDDDRIELGSNPLNKPPSEFINLGVETILEYFEDSKKFGTQEINECKLIFIGDGGVGKTSLMKRLVSNEFLDGESTTHGINKIAWKEICNSEGDSIKINLWDFGGQHLQHSLHQFFLTKRVIYVLVLNPRNDEKADYWLKQIENLGDESEVLIVYNWKDEKDKEASFLANYYELKKAYPHISKPYLLSCKVNEGIEEFKSQIKATILSQANLKDQYPLNWFNIKTSLEELVTLERNYISYEEYEKICNINNYYDDIKRKNLLTRLDNIGSIVFFEDPNLIQLQVLNPDWITTFAYSIITSEVTNQKKGHLTVDDLKEIFKDEKEVFSNKITKVKYREDQFNFILKLMIKYDLCQVNPFKHNEHLFPTSFNGSPENDYSEIKLRGKHYRFLFDTEFEMLIMHRFISRNLKNSTSKDFWQSGIHINDLDGKTFALIETNRHTKVINCWIKGNNIRGLWEIIRNDIKDICKIYDNLFFQEQVSYNHYDEHFFLSYDEMLNSLRRGKRIIEWHPTLDIENIDVLNVIENFEDTAILMEEFNRQGIFINGNISNSQIGGKNNVQSNYINNYAHNNIIEGLKDILDDLQEAAKVNLEWQDNFTTALKAIYNLESATDKAEEKIQISKLKKFFSKAKEVKDWAAITLLPAEIASKGSKMISLGENLMKSLGELL